eukprot:1330869-Pyramimonas_sp.AAC.1
MGLHCMPFLSFEPPGTTRRGRPRRQRSAGGSVGQRSPAPAQRLNARRCGTTSNDRRPTNAQTLGNMLNNLGPLRTVRVRYIALSSDP